MRTLWQETWDVSGEQLAMFLEQIKAYRKASGGCPPDREAVLNAWAYVQKQRLENKSHFLGIKRESTRLIDSPT